MAVTSPSFKAEGLNLQATLYFSAFRVGVESQWVAPEEPLSGGLAVCMGTDVGDRRVVPGVEHLPTGPPHPHSDFIVSQMCGKHRE